MSWLENIEDRVIAAYRKNGLKPSSGSFDCGNGFACALMALVGPTRHRGADPIAHIANTLGASEHAVWDFIYGFDRTLELESDENTIASKSRRSKLLDFSEAAFDAGVRTANRVKEEGLL